MFGYNGMVHLFFHFEILIILSVTFLVSRLRALSMRDKFTTIFSRVKKSTGIASLADSIGVVSTHLDVRLLLRNIKLYLKKYTFFILILNLY